MSLAFKRVYVDIPTDTHDKLAARALVLGISQKRLLADLIERECAATSEASKKGGQRKKKGKVNG